MDCPEFARPLYEQRLEQALRLDPFLDHVETIVNEPLSDSEEDSDSEIYAEYLKNGLPTSKREEREDRTLMYNFTCVKKKRQWLKEALLSSSDDDTDTELTEADLQEMLREHKFRKKHQLQFYQKEENMSYMYYSAGVLSRVDKYPEHQKYLSGSKRKKNKDKKENEWKMKLIKEEPEGEDSKEALQPTKIPKEEPMPDLMDESSEELVVNLKSSRPKSSKKDKKPKKLDAQALAIRRHKLWVLMAKKEVGKCQKSKLSFRKEVLQNCKKMATGCMRYCRQKALQSQKTVKDKVWLLKRLTRTMQNEWKKYDRIMKEQSKRAEKEAEEQRKIDKEILEAKRQQRKMNFLITLPELYAHFMKNKMDSLLKGDEETNSILKQLEDDQPLPSSVVDDYDCEAMKAQAFRTAQDAYVSQISRANNFIDVKQKSGSTNSSPKEHSQPSIFVGQLKSYQLKGMNWLANLYYFGINGILADEMGLGKTVQSVAFLGHICEEYDTWGPFLIVTPASTLHNWTCEISRFVPSFKVVPYWGNPEERKNLRKFFDGKNLGTRDASFHLVVTSYQIVIQDFKFLNRLKWNYMVLDEAQAIKSINSQRWKQLLGFSCRNRLLLSGTPIQNSMAELWALLHFIMPTLFDSHNWFNEWFSKDIEGHVENKTAVDEKHLNRLHMILKPFMLRRVKTEVENELSDKIEVMMYCPLTLRQKYLYDGLKNKISIDELLRSSMNSLSFQSVTTSLMNLVMQFRKVCNHPELLERREVRSPFSMNPDPYVLPKLVYREGLLDRSLPSRRHLLYNQLSIYHPAYVHSTSKAPAEGLHTNELNCFSFLRFIDMNVGEFSKVALEGILIRWICILTFLEKSLVRHHRRLWGRERHFGKDALLIESPLSRACIQSSTVLPQLVFTSYNSSFYKFADSLIHYVPESKSHRLMRSQKLKNKIRIQDMNLDSISVKKELNPTLTNGTFIDDSFEFLETKLQPENNSPSKASHTSYLRSTRKNAKHVLKTKNNIKKEASDTCSIEDSLGLPEFPHLERDPFTRTCQPTSVPMFLLHTCAKAHITQKELYASDRSSAYSNLASFLSYPSPELSTFFYGSPQLEIDWKTRNSRIRPPDLGGLSSLTPKLGWSHILIPDKHTLIMDAGKLYVLDSLLSRLKAGNHRVLIYSQMTKMIDLLEEYMWHRKHKYMRLDGSSKISDRRDMVEDFQNKSDIFVFLLSTRAGGVGINLTAADTVIFYDSDWNPTVDQQAMDRAHRLGQTKQVTVFRLICKDTIEERILQRAREKSEIQRMVISGGNFRPDTLKPKEVVSLLLDADIEKEYRAKQAERRAMEDQKLELNREKMRERMRKRYLEKKWEKEQVEKRRKLEEDLCEIDVCGDPTLNSNPSSPTLSESSQFGVSFCGTDEGSSDALQIVDVETTTSATSTSTFSTFAGSSSGLGSLCGRLSPSLPPLRRQRKRGRPRGSGTRGRGSRGSEAGSQVLNGSLTPPDNGQVVNGEGGAAAAAVDTTTTTTTITTAAVATPLSTNSTSSSSSGGSVALKRGRGRPRLLPLGPGHQGTRPPPALPVALGSTLGSNLGTANQDKNSRSPFHFTSS